MTRDYFGAFKALAFAAVLAAAPGAASAQQGGDSPFSFFNRIFQENDSAAPPQEPQRVAQNAPSDLTVRIDRLEAQIRQLTGVIEQLQYRNQQLEAQLGRMQQAAGPQPPSPLIRQPAATGTPLPPPTGTAQSSVPGGMPQANLRRSDAFDPTLNPNAPGAPQSLGTLPVGSAPPADQGSNIAEAPIGAPGGRQAGAPLDLTTLGGNQAMASNPPYGGNQPPAGNPVYDATAPQSSALPPPPARNLSATGASASASVLPPSASPRDQYDLGYGYVLRKDYALAEDAFQTFLTKFPNDRLAPDAQFWLGESRFQRQRYDAAAEAFLQVSTKHATNAKAPEAMLRLGQSLAALGQREMACATLAEVGRKFPRATPNVKQGVEREQKRAKC